MIIELTDLYLCERCFSAADTPGPCPRCSEPRRHFQVGAVDDPCRRPPTDAEAACSRARPNGGFMSAPRTGRRTTRRCRGAPPAEAPNARQCGLPITNRGPLKVLEVVCRKRP